MRKKADMKRQGAGFVRRPGQTVAELIAGYLRWRGVQRVWTRLLRCDTSNFLKGRHRIIKK